MKTIFMLSNFSVMPFWLLMILLPRWRITERVMRSPWIVLPPALLYTVLVVPELGTLMPALARPNPTVIAAFLAGEAGTTIAWAHFLAFDLFVARWVYLDSRERRISPWLMAPVLYACLMVGPLGLIGYGVIRAALRLAALRLAAHGADDELPRRGRGEHDAEAGTALGGAIDGEAAAVLGDHALHQRQTEAG
jgi:hypothetical protein